MIFWNDFLTMDCIIIQAGKFCNDMLIYFLYLLKKKNFSVQY